LVYVDKQINLLRVFYIVLLNNIRFEELQMQAILRIQVSDERAAHIISDISVGSEPKLRFYTMVAA